VLEAINEAVGADLDERDRLEAEKIKLGLLSDPDLQAFAQVNTEEHYALEFGPKFKGAILDQEERNRRLYELLQTRPELAALLEAEMMKETYRELRLMHAVSSERGDQGGVASVGAAAVLRISFAPDDYTPELKELIADELQKQGLTIKSVDESTTSPMSRMGSEMGYALSAFSMALEFVLEEGSAVVKGAIFTTAVNRAWRAACARSALLRKADAKITPLVQGDAPPEI